MEILYAIAIIMVIIVVWLMVAEVIGELALPITIVAGILSLIFLGVGATIAIVVILGASYLLNNKF
jgi:hypothetical protein